MTKNEMREAILNAKQTLSLSWEALGLAVGLSPEFTCSACLGMNRKKRLPMLYVGYWSSRLRCQPPCRHIP